MTDFLKAVLDALPARANDQSAIARLGRFLYRPSISIAFALHALVGILCLLTSDWLGAIVFPTLGVLVSAIGRKLFP